MNRGKVWWGELADAGRRPFLVMTRSRAVPVLASVVVAPLTGTVRGLPTELSLGREDGLPEDCAASFDHLSGGYQGQPHRAVCSLVGARMAEACQALRNAVDC